MLADDAALFHDHHAQEPLLADKNNVEQLFVVIGLAAADQVGAEVHLGHLSTLAQSQEMRNLGGLLLHEWHKGSA